MNKITFNDRYGLTQAVLDGRKTMTRRIVPDKYVPLIDDGQLEAALTEAQRHGDAYRIGEIVAVAQTDDPYRYAVHNDICFDIAMRAVELAVAAEHGWHQAAEHGCHPVQEGGEL